MVAATQSFAMVVVVSQVVPVVVLASQDFVVLEACPAQSSFQLGPVHPEVVEVVPVVVAEEGQVEVVARVLDMLLKH